MCEKWLLWNHAYSLWLEHRFLFQWYSAVIHSKRSEGFLLIKLSKVWIIHFICWGLISFLSYKHEYEICFKNTGIKLWIHTNNWYTSLLIFQNIYRYTCIISFTIGYKFCLTSRICFALVSLVVKEFWGVDNTINILSMEIAFFFFYLLNKFYENNTFNSCRRICLHTYAQAHEQMRNSCKTNNKLRLIIFVIITFPHQTNLATYFITHHFEAHIFD